MNTTDEIKTPRKRNSRGRTPSGKPNPIDVHVGGRVRLRRALLGMSQEKLGDALGLTFQQVQKYERGANRIGSSRLFDLSRVLDVPVSFFFDDMPAEVGSLSPRHMMGIADEPAEFGADPMNRRETVDLVRVYYRIADPSVRRRVLDLAKALGAVADQG